MSGQHAVHAHRAGVVGAGVMGRGIVQSLAESGAEVWVADADLATAEAGVAAVVATWAGLVERGKADADTVAAASARVTAVASVAALPVGLDLVVEAVSERPEVKTAVLGEIEARTPGVLATNTSALSIDALAAGLLDPARFVGMHFFNPVPVMPLVEVVRGSTTGDAALAMAHGTAAALGKTSIEVADRPGFASSRLGVLLGLEAMRMLAEGVASASDIDTAMRLGYRHPMGPLELTDLVGLDVRLDIARGLALEYGDRFAPPPLLEAKVAAGELGRKTGRGFYDWTSGERRDLDEEWGRRESNSH